MKNLFKVKLGILAILVALSFVFVGCTFEDEEPIDEIDFTNYQTTYSIKISNETNHDLVAFKGSVSKDNILGGIRAKADGHGLQHQTVHFPTTPAKIKIMLVTAKDYNDAAGNYAALNEAPFGLFYVFWNGKSGDNEKIYSISGRLGGENTLELWNTSSFDIELRDNGINGPTMGYAPRNVLRTKLYVANGEYYVYPILQRENTVRDIIETIVPRRSSGKPYGWGIQFGENEKERYQALDLADATNLAATQRIGAAIVYVDNQGDNAVTFYMGNTPMTSPAGYQMINRNGFREFIVDMLGAGTGSGENASFADTRRVSGWRVNMMGSFYPVKDEEGNTDFVLETDKQYTVTVLGDEDTCNATININAPADFTMKDVVLSDPNAQ